MTMQFVAKLKQLWRNERGSIAQMVGLSMLAICVAIGAAIDYGRITNAQSRLSAAMDAAVLQVARDPTVPLGDMKTLAETTLKKNYGTDDYDKVTNFDLTYDNATGKLKASATVTVKTWFMSLVGIKSQDIPVSSEAQAGGKNIEVALVLDNTGSMSADAGGGKSRIEVLIDSAKQFVDTVIADPDGQTPNFSKAALVPFAGTVNPGTLLSGSRLAVKTPSSCTAIGCSTYKPSEYTKYTMNNCVTERMGADATTDADITSSRATWAYNHDSGSYDAACIEGTVKLLSTDKSALKSAIAAMKANGGTAGHVGLQWGYQMLSPNSGLSTLAGDTNAKPGPYNDAKYKKIMLFMTDGEMTEWACNGIMSYKGWSPVNGPGGCTNPNGDSQAQAVATCNNIKNSQIELYFIGIGLDMGNSDVVNLTKACSTDAAHIVLATDGAGLSAAFAQIAANIRAMRLTM